MLELYVLQHPFHCKKILTIVKIKQSRKNNYRAK